MWSDRGTALVRHNDKQEADEFGASFESRSSLFSLLDISES